MEASLKKNIINVLNTKHQSYKILCIKKKEEIFHNDLQQKCTKYYKTWHPDSITVYKNQAKGLKIVFFSNGKITSTVRTYN